MLKTALVGLGRIGFGKHFPEILKQEQFKLVAVVDPKPEYLSEVKEKYNINGYKDIDEMLDNEKPQLVVIASPTIFHMEQAVLSMEKGADVFIDKPLAIDYNQALKIEETRKRTGKKIMSYQPYRLTAETQTIKIIMEKGILGDIYMIKRADSAYIRRNDWQAFKKYGGGMINNYASHYIDSLIYLLNENVSVIDCNAFKIASMGDAEDVVKILLKTDKNIILDIDINMATSQKIHPWMVFGKYGTAIFTKDENNQDVFNVRYYDKDEIPNQDEITNQKLPNILAAKGRKYCVDNISWKTESIPIIQENEINYYAKCKEYFVDGLEPIVPFYETLNLMKLIQTCKEKSGWA